MATIKSVAVEFDFVSSDILMGELKSHKANFELFGGFNNRTSGWMTHPKRKPIYELIGKLAFAFWNESLRFDTDFSSMEVYNECNGIFNKIFRRKVQRVEMEKLFKIFRKCHRETLRKSKEVE
ncbi:hypothetical protein [Pseudomonas syringae]|uniref:hypothetical protein n=1 Tax=Pseudomonas syringae TaxID=317 RepID=UPI001F29DC3F|nr:hypothetical protein [Pseudomonas syringae]MBL3827756.1 hypothetical protein [Pseudomonas syringae pv. theae]MBL3837180.1 hypothetical protein [Pseudomonas syringae pv. theae]GKQ45056.1 hypothetical protein PSTH2693_07890 [Pseudomonas syringae pv. theae]